MLLPRMPVPSQLQLQMYDLYQLLTDDINIEIGLPESIVVPKHTQYYLHCEIIDYQRHIVIEFTFTLPDSC
jgi:hypothetical protein